MAESCLEETAELLPSGEEKAAQCAAAAQACEQTVYLQLGHSVSSVQKVLLLVEPKDQSCERASLCEEALDWIRKGSWGHGNQNSWFGKSNNMDEMATQGDSAVEDI